MLGAQLSRDSASPQLTETVTDCGSEPKIIPPLHSPFKLPEPPDNILPANTSNRAAGLSWDAIVVDIKGPSSQHLAPDSPQHLQRTISSISIAAATMSTRNSISAAIPIPASSVDAKHWWRHKNLFTLNMLMVFPLLSLFTQG
ncbi:hypothetical protein ASPCAL09610 [Aspergillus calidoustus]|uniref:Uncharacterized protein n=1 Tax=Aspergillus calidoustus TaxID=454130 RepID=A0A0U5G3I4_ASPCI|nr:hypothetical protein ASPCAL09610 [Aspergillus calidoustus]